MKKLLMGSIVLTIFSISMLIFQFSCKKDAIAQQTSSCSETATVIFDINFPLTVAVNTVRSVDNSIYLSTERNGLDAPYNCSQYQDFRNVGGAHQKTYTFKGLIPGTYNYRVNLYITSNNTVKSIPIQSIILAAGQTYSFKINDVDFK